MKQPITVKTTVDTRAKEGGLIIPKGTTGNVIGFYKKNALANDLVIDFGLLRVVILPTDSHLITISSPFKNRSNNGPKTHR
jgi:hypothetical protein